jgi:hypothetical protein
MAVGPKTKYDNEEIRPSIRRYVIEHLQIVDRTLADLERLGCIVLGTKLELCQDGVIIVGYYIDLDGRHPDVSKVAVIA